jgi:hypothetical protein
MAFAIAEARIVASRACSFDINAAPRPQACERTPFALDWQDRVTDNTSDD